MLISGRVPVNGENKFLNQELYSMMRPHYVCNCMGVSEKSIRGLIEDEGIVDFDAISARTGCSTECGQCKRTVESILAEYTDHEES